MTFGLNKSTVSSEHKIVSMTNQSQSLIIVPKLPGYLIESRAKINPFHSFFFFYRIKKVAKQVFGEVKALIFFKSECDMVCVLPCFKLEKSS